jgi:thymidylate synthase
MIDTKYKKLVKHVYENGTDKKDRTGTGTRSVFGYQMRFPVRQKAFPIVTRKKTFWRSLAHELLWFLSGDANIAYLERNNVGIWDEWADENGDLGPVYGVQWRRWGDRNIDQLQNVITNLKENPDSRRHIVTAWNPTDVEDMKLPPCHMMFQFYSKPTDIGRELSVQMYQRSCDVFLGVPFNLSSYSLLLVMISKLTGHVPGEMIWTGGDVHIYQNHFQQVEKFLDLPAYDLPELWINPMVETIDDYTYDDIELRNYQHGPFIKAPVAV